MESSFIDFYTMSKIQQKNLSKDQIENYPAFTTFKYREESGYVKRTIDYMFLAENRFQQQNKVVVEQMLNNNIPDSALDMEMANPCQDHPSDHYSLAYVLRLEFNQ